MTGFRTWIRAVGAATGLENPSQLMLWNTHKAYLTELAGAGVPVVATRVLGPDAGAAQRYADALLARLDGRRCGMLM